MRQNGAAEGNPMRLAAPAILLVLLAAAPVRAADPASLCDQAAAVAAANHGVPLQVMLAITRVETGRGGALHPWPWAVNLGADGHWPDDRSAAVALAQSELDLGRLNIDVGCFQLNIRWHSRAFASLDDMFDPALNADRAARFLAQLYTETGSWQDATAAYHSRTEDLGQAYVARVEEVLAALVADPPPPSPPAPAPRGVNLFPLLQPGEAGTKGSLVPGGAGNGPLIGAGS